MHGLRIVRASYLQQFKAMGPGSVKMSSPLVVVWLSLEEQTMKTVPPHSVSL